MKKKTIRKLGLEKPIVNQQPRPANIAARLRRIKTELDLMSAHIGAFLERDEVHQQDSVPSEFRQ